MATPRIPRSQHKERSNTARTIRRLIGDDDAMALFKAFGGTLLYIPTVERLRERNKLVRAVGWESAAALCREYGGIKQLYIPTGKTRRSRLKVGKVRQLRALGTPVSQIAREVHCSQKAVHEWIARQMKQRKNSPQTDWTFQV